MLLSIIVPIYNAEKYIKECIDSILNQTFSDFELLLIDDGSTDNSRAICDNYKTIDNRVKVIHKQNGGISSARNYGLKIAKGSYIGFVDDDDYIEKNYYDVLVKGITDNNADLSYCGLITNISNSNKSKTEIFVDNWFRNSFIKKSPGIVWLSLYKKEIIDMYGITFPKDREIVYEDILFDIDYIKYCNNIYSCGDETTYYYRYNEESFSHKYDINRFNKLTKSINYYRDKLIENESSEIEKETAMMFWPGFEKCINSIIRYKCENKCKEIEKLCDNNTTKEYVTILLKNHYLSGAKKILCYMVKMNQSKLIFVLLKCYNIIKHKEI